MKISITEKHKSLYPFESEELDDFTIITGKNGSGKSQLIGLMTPSVPGAPHTPIKTRFQSHLTRVQVEGIVKESDMAQNHQQWLSTINERISIYNQLPSTLKALFGYIGKHNLVTNDIISNGILSTEQEYIELLKAAANTTASYYPHLQHNTLSGSGRTDEQFNLEIQSTIVKPYLDRGRNWIFELINQLCEASGKKAEELAPTDFYKFPIPEHLTNSNDLFTSQLDLVFYSYAKRRNLNQRNFFSKKEYEEDNNSISDIDFVSKFTPPWTVINQLLNEHKIHFNFKGIDRSNFSADLPMHFPLYNTITNEVIDLSELSSGEKIIIGLTIKLFTSEYYGENLAFPELLIFDEPDAHLHPEMSKLLLDILSKTFVERYGMKVIIITHSPTTIALADEKHIFQLKNGSDTSLMKVSKDEALKILTGFIPTLSIDYKKHRQIFVESPTDVLYYQSIYEKRVQEVNLSHKLYFISNAPGKSNCSQVYGIVNQIRVSGNVTAFGIVDWDSANAPTEFIRVHGLDERYSIENFILDPIYLVCLLIDTNNAHGVMEAIGITTSYNQYLLGGEANERIQSIVTYYFSKFEERFPSYKYDSEKVTVHYLNGRCIQVPKWYLLMQGHEIVDKVQQIFPALNQPKYRTEGAMQKVLITIMSKCYPFVPLTSVHLLEGLAGVV